MEPCLHLPPQSPFWTARSHAWDRLSVRGLLAAESIELPVPRDHLPHLVTRGGKTIRGLENRLGVIIGVMDGSGETALVLVVGPLDRLEVARRVVEIMSLGARSFLDRLHRTPPLG